jgi:chloride channel protein, CIC family
MPIPTRELARSAALSRRDLSRLGDNVNTRTYGTSTLAAWRRIPRFMGSHGLTSLFVAPSLAPTLERDHAGRAPTGLDRRDVWMSMLAMALAIAAVGIAEVLVRAIALVTNLAYFHRVSLVGAEPRGNPLGYLAALVPICGGIVVGIMARFGSRAIRGHGIPEAMEQILTNESRIPLRVTFLKPLSAAIAIGTGGPFGAEGPIIATGGALGSAIGQFVRVTARERKVLLAAGAAAGMTAIFGTPIAAVLLAIELLLTEYSARTVTPVALACAVAGGVRAIIHGTGAVFAVPPLDDPSTASVVVATVCGGLIGIVSVYVTRAVYAIEDGFERLHSVHWMWWPAIGGVAVGVIGLACPRTLGVGYDNITTAVGGGFAIGTLAVLAVAKFVSWSIALGSGTSGGTLAPLLTLGAALGYVLAYAAGHIAPSLHVDPRVAALVGMTAMFAGASRALLASIAFALESTQQIHVVVPIVGGVTLAYFASAMLMRTTIMTEKLARRGVEHREVIDVHVATEP